MTTLRRFRQLRSLNLWCAPVTDAGLENLKGLVRHQDLDLAHTQISDAGLEALTGLKELKKLNLSDTKATDTGLQRLKKALPACEIEH